MFVPEYEPKESKYITHGTYADLKNEGMIVFPASRGVPTTEIESSRPFFLRFTEKNESGKTYTIFSNFRKFRHDKHNSEFRERRGLPQTVSDDWFVALDGHPHPSDERDFEVIFLQKDDESIAPFWLPKGKDTIVSMLAPFVNEHDDFNGYVIGIRESSMKKNADLSKTDLTLFFEGTEAVSDLAENYDIKHVAIQYQNEQSGFVEYALINLETMMVTHNSKAI
ncbi:hypothetical protein [Vibrio crassostreae]|uniref:hypothetical protein n=1 Tax=Vibrio crassostreae TaxID=246167 RepID=UPI001B3040F9|nr:hypothetical protein [Vibrio crassostreae]